ncbi:hypothetical protein H8L32_06470 [Undibacterium sp. CY18W]|uniref:Uncharacterized protein n=1 Tax=Undibacterium hunanense TaxID=2762292 RepID=A0ABR6ZMK5_9BURK|nr:hypothetical protein [Undibacterium hunanense]
MPTPTPIFVPFTNQDLLALQALLALRVHQLKADGTDAHEFHLQNLKRLHEVISQSIDSF